MVAAERKHRLPEQAGWHVCDPDRKSDETQQENKYFYDRSKARELLQRPPRRREVVWRLRRGRSSAFQLPCAARLACLLFLKMADECTNASHRKKTRRWSNTIGPERRRLSIRSLSLHIGGAAQPEGLARPDLQLV